jgi:fructose/tagatose bisphosphate aldolase
MRCFRLGFTSLMFDGSSLPYEENVARTAEIVRVAHSVGVTVEAELGQVGGGEGASEASEADRSLFHRSGAGRRFRPPDGCRCPRRGRGFRARSV